jgi:hypothetical protein
LCDEATGACVECTQDDRTACAVDGNGKRDVCNAATHECEVGVKEGTAPLCGSIDRKQCVSNAHCPAGSTCVQEFLRDQTFSAWYCLPTMGSPSCKRPFAREQTRPTRDGDAAAVCALRLSTCTAHSQYTSTSMPCTSDTDPSAGDNAKCGLPGLDDGYCVYGGTVLGFVCTVPCTSADADCPVDATECVSLDHSDGKRSLCST